MPHTRRICPECIQSRPHGQDQVLKSMMDSCSKLTDSRLPWNLTLRFNKRRVGKTLFVLPTLPHVNHTTPRGHKTACPPYACFINTRKYQAKVLMEPMCEALDFRRILFAANCIHQRLENVRYKSNVGLVDNLLAPIA